MPRYEYRCPQNGVVLEVRHGMSDEVRTWGELCALSEQDVGNTPASTPVERAISLPFVGAARSASGGFVPPAGGCGPSCGCAGP